MLVKLLIGMGEEEKGERHDPSVTSYSNSASSQWGAGS